MSLDRSGESRVMAVRVGDLGASTRELFGTSGCPGVGIVSAEQVALLVDIDGVVTDEFAVIDTGVLELLGCLAAQGCGLAFITGRSSAWVETNMWPLLGGCSGDGGAGWLDEVVFAVEMGAQVTVGMGGTGWEASQEYGLPQSLREGLERLCARGQYSGLLTWDDTKRVTATAEAVHLAGDPQHWRHVQAALRRWEYEARLLLGPSHEVHRSTYAVDVLRSGLTKRVGARFALDYFGGRALPIRRVFALGDGPADPAMAAEAYARAVKATFVWLGRGPAPQPDGWDVVVPERPHCEGAHHMLPELVRALMPRSHHARRRRIGA